MVGSIADNIQSCFASRNTGIGQGRVTQNVQGAPVDYAILVKDREAVEMVSEGRIMGCTCFIVC